MRHFVTLLQQPQVYASSVMSLVIQIQYVCSLYNIGRLTRFRPVGIQQWSRMCTRRTNTVNRCTINHKQHSTWPDLVTLVLALQVHTQQHWTCWTILYTAGLLPACENRWPPTYRTAITKGIIGLGLPYQNAILQYNYNQHVSWPSIHRDVTLGQVNTSIWV